MPFDPYFTSGWKEPPKSTAWVAARVAGYDLDEFNQFKAEHGLALRRAALRCAVYRTMDGLREAA